MKRISSKSEEAFYGESFSYTACQWIEAMSRETGRHIHHALCGHGGERVLRELGKELCKVCLLYTSPSPRDKRQSRMPSSA